MTGIYLHIPYCIKKCNYCDFFSLPSLDTKAGYLRALKYQMAGFSSGQVDSIYFGGGTPSLLAEGEIGGLIAAIKKHFGVSKNCEITLEMNPASCDKERLRGFRRVGVNRLSIGIQSFNDRSLSLLGRLHNADAARRAIRDAKQTGFGNISADLILALPNENERDIAEAVGTLGDSGVTHISAYLLKIMEHTFFFDYPPDGIPDDDRQADLYLFAVDTLHQHGFFQYEISNFANPGFESRHNLKYWNCLDYIGLGAAAHSSIDGRRYSYPPDISRFIDDFSVCCDDALPFFTFEGEVDQKDYIMMRLRTAGGLDCDLLRARFGLSFGKQTNALIALYEDKGLVRLRKSVLSLSKKGMLVSNAVIAGLFDAIGKDADL